MTAGRTTVPTKDAERRALVTGTAIVIAGAIPSFLAASLAPRIRADFAFGDVALGVAAASFYGISMLGSFWLMRMLERIGAWRGMLLAAVFTALASAGIAALASSAVGLIVGLAVAGIGNALASPAASMMLQSEVPAARQGLAYGLLQAGAPMGALTAGLALPAVAIPIGWRWAFLAVAPFAIAAALAAPRGARSSSARERVQRPEHRGVVYALGVAAFFASAAGVGFLSFLVVYAVEHGVHEGVAGLLFAAVSTCGAIGRITLGLHGDRSGTEPMHRLPVMFTIAVAGYALMLTGVPALILVSAVLAGGFGWAWPGALNLAVVQRSPDAAAWAVGVLMAGLFAGAIFGPIVAGFLAEHDIWEGVWLLCAVLALSAAATLAAVRRHEAGQPAGTTR